MYTDPDLQEARAAVGPSAAPVAPKPADNTDPAVTELEDRLAAAEAERDRLTAELRRAKQSPVDVDAIHADTLSKLVREIEAIPEKLLQLLDDESEARKARAAKTPAAPKGAEPTGEASESGGTKHSGHRRGPGESHADHKARIGVGGFGSRFFA